MKLLFGWLAIVLMVFPSCKPQTSYETLEPLEFSELMSYDFHAIVLDVRTPEEYREGHIEGAVNMDFYADGFEKQLEKLDKEKSYFVYCTVGGRSSSAAKMMHDKGFQKVHDLSGGIEAWENSGLPITLD